MKIIIETIPHDSQKYETVGNYWKDPDGTQHIVVSDMGNDDYAFLVGLHELVEAKLCEKRGITDDAITAFDEAFEAKRGEDDESEPGDEPDAPYAKEHCTATAVERLMCAELGLSWKEYEAAVNSLSKT